MPTGFQSIHATAGTVQIDEQFRNLFVRQSGVGGTIPAYSGFNTPLLAIQSSTMNRYDYGMAVPAGVKWWIFDILQPGQATNAGFQVFDAAGNLIYDAGCKPLRIAGAHTGITGAGSAGYPAGRSYATIMGVVNSQFFEQSTKAGGANWNNREGRDTIGMAVSGTTISWNWFTEWLIEWTSDTQEFSQSEVRTSTNSPASIMVVDVTNY